MYTYLQNIHKLQIDWVFNKLSLVWRVNDYKDCIAPVLIKRAWKLAWEFFSHIFLVFNGHYFLKIGMKNILFFFFFCKRVFSSYLTSEYSENFCLGWNMYNWYPWEIVSYPNYHEGVLPIYFGLFQELHCFFSFHCQFWQKVKVDRKIMLQFSAWRS